MKYFTILIVLIGNLIAEDWVVYKEGDHWFVNLVYKNCITAYVNDGFSSLDFSEINPNLNRLELMDRKSNWELQPKLEYLAKDDAGLSKNTRLKEIYVWSDHSQIPVSLSYLPSVERYENFLFAPYHDFDYLSKSLPSLKTLYYTGSLDSSFREKLHIRLENINKLTLLENLTLHTYASQWGDKTFTDEELLALSKMHSLKNFTLEITYSDPFENRAFDNEKLQTLKSLLPNTKIKIDFRRIYPSED